MIWRHSMCMECFRKHWPHGKYSSFQALPQLRQWETCCFCLKKHKSAIHIKRNPNNRELQCEGIAHREPIQFYRKGQA